MDARTQAIDESSLRLTGEQLGKGGEGSAHALAGRLSTGQSAVFKKYHVVPQPASQDHIANLTSALYSFSPEQRAWLLAHTAWPTSLVLNPSRQIVGFIMPRIPDRYFHDFPSKDGTVKGPRDIQYLFEPPHRADWIGLNVSLKDRYQVLASIAQGFNNLHQLGIRVGDVSPKNLLFSTASQGGADVFFLDCDSMSLSSSKNPSTIETSHWEVPESVEKDSTDSDQYKFALIVLRTLSYEQMTRNVSDLPADIPDEIVSLVTWALERTGPVVPSFEEWSRALRRASRSQTARTGEADTAEVQREAPKPQPRTTTEVQSVPARTREAMTPPTTAAPAANLPASVVARSTTPKKPERSKWVVVGPAIGIIAVFIAVVLAMGAL